MPTISLLPVFLATAAAATAVMGLAWLWSVLRKDAGVVDIMFGLGLIAIAAVALLQGQASGPRKLLLPILVGLWGLRLTLYVGWRNLIVGLPPGGELGEKEDRRYRAMRRKAGASFVWKSFFTVFMRRALIMWAISMPLQVSLATTGRRDLFWLDYLGFAVFGLGLALECVADWQLGNFRINPGSHGQVLTTGIWRYTRHPNYLGEAMVWWGLFLVAAGAGQAVFYTAFAPLLVTFLLVKVSGIPAIEEGMAARRPPYRAYAERTSAFLPWLPTDHQGATAREDAPDAARLQGARAS